MKYGKWVICFLVVLILPFVVRAYDYANNQNKSNVESKRKEVYELYKFYEEMFPTVEDEDEDYVSNNVCSSSSYMWPIGSDKTTKEGNNKNIV